MKSGIVYRATGSWYTVKSDGTFYPCRIRGKIRLEGSKSTNPVVVGDRVFFELSKEAVSSEGVILKIEKRKNHLIRKSVNLSKQTHVIAANIDLAFLVVTLSHPPTSTVFIDRFLVSAKAYEIPVVLVFNKIDLHTAADTKQYEMLCDLYTRIGYPCEAVSAFNGTGIERLKKRLQGNISVFSGHSGVGKSSLLNALAPTLDIATKAVSEKYQQGQHTTTFAEMYDLEGEISIMDTPGIKGFGLAEMDAEDIGRYFPEFLDTLGSCKFYNCLHINEPECAVCSLLEKGAIAPSRYKSYLQMLEQNSTHRK